MARYREERVLGMTDFLLKEICYLLYHLINRFDDGEMTRDGYLKGLVKRYNEQLEAPDSKRKK